MYKKKVLCADTDNSLLVRDQAMGSENPRDWLGEFCINLSSGR